MQDGRITQGTLRTTDGIVLALELTEVEADVRGPIATARVRQVFRNTERVAVEVVYSFPLPHTASVFEMVMRIGGRTVRGVVKEKEEARRAFAKARSEGRAASLLEQTRTDLFTLSATNVAPGETIEVTLGYQERLVFDEGEWRFVFPMVAPERYLPAPTRGGEAAVAQGVRPPRVPSGQRTSDVRVEVRLHDPHLAPPRSPSHRIEVEARREGGYRVRLHAAERIPNRDFVLALRDERRGVRAEVLFEREKGRPGTFLLVVRPPDLAPEAIAALAHAPSAEGRPIACGNCGGPLREPGALVTRPGIGPSWRCPYCGIVVATADRVTEVGGLPRDVIFLVDRSASMRGGALAQAGRAVARVIEGLDPSDAVQVIAFDHERFALDGRGDGYVARDEKLGKRVAAFLSELSPRGGTELEAAFERAAKMPVRAGRTRLVVLVSDAAVGNEGRLLRRVKELLGDETRLYVLGVGPAVDRYLVEKLARVGGGASDVLLPGEDVETVVPRFARRVGQAGPVLRRLALAWGDAMPADVYPSPVPDLFGGQTVQLLGRYSGEGPSLLVLTGETATGRPFRQEVDVSLPPESSDTPGLERLWARARIEARLDRLLEAPDEAADVRAEVLGLALRHGLMSPYTSLIAEDSEVAVDPQTPLERVDIAAPLPGPEGAPGGSVTGVAGGDMTSVFEGGEVPVGAPRSGFAPALLSASSASYGAPPAAGGFGPPGARPAPPPSFTTPPPAPLATARGLPASPAAPAAPMRTRLGTAKPAAGDIGTPKRGALGSLVGRVSDAVRGVLHPEPSPPAETAAARAPAEGAGAQGGGQGQGDSAPLKVEGDAYSAEAIAWARGRNIGQIDLVFLVDETGSMGPYIEEVKKHLLALVAAIRATPLARSLRLGLVTYRDHPPQDTSFVSRVAPLTDDVETMRKAVMAMRASGGGDGPEAVTDGLVDLVRLAWRPDAARVVVWVGDAPPHGVEPSGDGFPQGCPCGHHWYTQAEGCREMGVTVHAVGCLPALRNYVGAEEVFRTVARVTRGVYLPLDHAARLIPFVLGVTEAELDRQRITEYVADVVSEHGAELGASDEAERVRYVKDVLRARGVEPRALAPRSGASSASLRFRPLEEADVERALDDLRRRGRAAV